MEVLKELFNNATDIIAKASTNTLGIIALVMLVFAVLGFLFFHDAPKPIQVGIYVLLFFGTIFLIVSTIQPSPTKHLSFEPTVKPTDENTDKSPPTNSPSPSKLLQPNQVGVMLILQAKPGEIAHYKYEASINIEAANKQNVTDMLRLKIVEFEKATVREVTDLGDVTIKAEAEHSEISINGRTVTLPESSSSTYTYRSNNILIAARSSTNSLDNAEWQATNVVFPNKSMKVGESWSYEYEKNSELGLHPAIAEFKVLSIENVDRLETVKIKMICRQKFSSRGFYSNGIIWLERKSGDTVIADFEVDDIPIDFGEYGNSIPAYGSGTIHLERISGSLL